MTAYMKDGKFQHMNTEAPPDGPVLPLFSLRGRTAIISGAAAGIGRAVAQAFAEAGANLVIWYNTNENAIREAENISAKYGVICKAYQVDVTVFEQVERAVDLAVRELQGRLDIFVANAGTPGKFGPFIDGDLQLHHDVMKVNVDGVFFCAKAAGKHFRRQKLEGTTIDGRPLSNFRVGSFIVTASMSGHIVNIPQSEVTYNASKAAVIHMVKTLAIEWTGFARVNTVSPGYIETELSKLNPAEIRAIWRDKIPMGREGQTVELKGAYLYLASDASSYMTGADISCDGGYSVV